MIVRVSTPSKFPGGKPKLSCFSCSEHLILLTIDKTSFSGVEDRDQHGDHDSDQHTDDELQSFYTGKQIIAYVVIIYVIDITDIQHTPCQ